MYKEHHIGCKPVMYVCMEYVDDPWKMNQCNNFFTVRWELLSTIKY